MERIVITDFPLPISTNESFAPMGKMGRFVNSKKKKYFEAQALRWSQFNGLFLLQTRSKINQWVSRGYGIKIELYYCFRKDRVLTTSKPIRPKSLDGQNRSKPCVDALFKLLGYDDKIIFNETAEKLYIENEESQCTIIVMEPTSPRTKCEILGILKANQTQIQIAPSLLPPPRLDQNYLSGKQKSK